MSAEDSIAKVNQAVDRCLEQCAAESVPFSAMRDFLKELWESGEYSAEEIAIVEKAVHRILKEKA